MITKEFLLNELRNKTKIQIGKENNLSRHQIYRLEKKLGIKPEDYKPIYKNKEMLEKLISEYGTIAEVARHLNVKLPTIAQWCTYYKITAEKRRNLVLNEEYFKKIDTEHKAYWLGYLMADGSMNKECTKLTLNLSKNDECMLEILKKDLNSSSTIKYSTNNGFDYARLMIGSQKMCKDLIYHGIVPKKSGKEILPDTIPKKLIRHFIRGFIDGDGSIGRHHFSMICNSEKFAIQIRDKFLEAIPELKSYLYKENRKYTDYWSLHFSMNLKVARKIYDYLYKNATVFLKRKEIILNTVLNTVDKRTVQCRA